MIERYQRIGYFDEKLWCDGCPILIVRYALLRDLTEAQDVLQLKFCNLQKKRIIAIHLTIEISDASLQVLDTVRDFSYEHLAAAYGSEFGSLTPLPLPVTGGKKFRFLIQSVQFADGTSWQGQEFLSVVPPRRDLWELGDLRFPFQNEVKQLSPKTPCLTLPADVGGLWYCVCGTLNFQSEKTCRACHIEKEALFALAVPARLEELAESQRIAQEQRRLEQEKVQAEIQEQRIKRRKKRLIKISVISLLLILLATGGFVIRHLINPMMQYKKAVTCLTDSDYKQAEELFLKLGGYKDSEQQVLESRYRQANDYLKNGKFDQAIDQLGQLNDYKDSSTLRIDALYQKAEKLLEAGDDEEVLNLLSSDKEFQDSDIGKQLRKEYDYALAVKALEKKDYENAYTQFQAIAGFRDSGEKSIECLMKIFEQALKERNWPKAEYQIRRMPIGVDREELKAQVLEAKYKAIDSYYYDTQIGKVYECVSELAELDYKDSRQRFEDWKNSGYFLWIEDAAIYRVNESKGLGTDANRFSILEEWAFSFTLCGYYPESPQEVVVYNYYPNDYTEEQHFQLSIGETGIMYASMKHGSSSRDTGYGCFTVFLDNGSGANIYYEIV